MGTERYDSVQMQENTDQNTHSFYVVKVELNICKPFRTYRKYVDQISKKWTIFTKYNAQRWEKIITYQMVLCTTVIVCPKWTNKRH